MIIYINNIGFTLVNPITKKADELKAHFNFFVSIKGARNIYQAYKTTPSSAKIKAYEKWSRFCEDINGNYITVLGANCYMFSCGFYHTHGLFIINPSSRYFVPASMNIYEDLKRGCNIW